MCGRTRLKTNAAELQRVFGLRLLPELTPHWNIAPSQPIAIIRTPGELDTATFGLVPSFAQEPKVKWVNAKAETIARQSAFRDAFRHRRCLVVVDGFYEWLHVGQSKQPYLVRLKSGEPFALAGIWERWESRTTGEVVDSCAVITTAAQPPLQQLHDRQPVILSPQEYGVWLDPSTRDAGRLLATQRADELEMVAVSTAVNSPRNDGPECEMPAEQGELPSV